MSRKINIRPTTSVYATYKNINYHIWTALAEFIDNSTQSFYDHKNELKNLKYWNGMNVEINYVNNDNENSYIEIIDNAYGMDFNDFKRAIILDSPPKKASRSEFGMGLKTAACWFGLKWSVESTMLGNPVKYKTIVDVEMLSKYKNEEIEVEEIPCNPKDHGTVIKIWNLNRGIKGSRTIGKTKSMISSMYRMDLRTNDIKLFYNGDELKYEDPEIYEEVLNNGTIETWKKEFSFVVEHNGKNYSANGYIAIRDKASTSEAGLTLIRRGRVIRGGFDENYRPSEVFGKPNSYEYQRLFGEVYMDSWPVIQTKDNFDWMNGLEDLFIEQLVEITKDYVKKAQKIRKRDKIKENELVISTINNYTQSGIIENATVADLSTDNYVQNDDLKESIPEEYNDIDIQESFGKSITFDKDGVTYQIDLVIEKNEPTAHWLRISNKSGDNYKVIWNVRHPFFKPFIDKVEFLQLMENLIFAMVIAEIESKKVSVEGRVEYSEIRNRMNEILKQLVVNR